MSRYDKVELSTARERINALFGENNEPARTEGAAFDSPEVRGLIVKARAMLDSAVEEDRNESLI